MNEEQTSSSNNNSDLTQQEIKGLKQSFKALEKGNYTTYPNAQTLIDDIQHDNYFDMQRAVYFTVTSRARMLILNYLFDSDDGITTYDELEKMLKRCSSLHSGAKGMDADLIKLEQDKLIVETKEGMTYKYSITENGKELCERLIRLHTFMVKENIFLNLRRKKAYLTISRGE